MANLKRNKITDFLASPRLTVIGLAFLAILVIWGTIYQANNGLYAATQKFFHSWITLLGGFIPFPGAILVMTVLFVNLVTALVFRIGFRWGNIGNFLIHLGLLLLLAGSFLTFQFAQESVLQFKEGESISYSSSFHEWELATWIEQNYERQVYAVDANGFRPRRTLTIPQLNLQISILAYHRNCQAFTGSSSHGVLNVSGITALEPTKIETEPSANCPGILFNARVGQVSKEILLYGNETKPTLLALENGIIGFSLRKKRFLLPFSLRLLDFRALFYPGSEIPRSYESIVSLDTGGQEREVLVAMNKPLRYKDYTLYQSSYFTDQAGNEYSVLAVVKNWGRLLPYYSSGLIFLGLILHFLIMLISRKARPGTDSAPDSNTQKTKR